ncbi:MAG: UvrD-helicase domain-containing protein [Planctomycetes bacterium]|nr:UvrD-helicase domain-containing protein [Planctomycetota bacterium]
MSKPIDNDVRELAVSEQDRNIVVTAGAGTGKTTLLVNRMLHLLLGHKRFQAEESPILRVVAMTFTEKAASDLKVRLMDELEKIVAVINGNAASEEKIKGEEFLAHIRDTYQTTYREIERRARKSLEDMDKSLVGTIHSFAAYILRLYPIESGVAPGFAVDEGDIFDELFDKEWTKWLDAELVLASPNANVWKDVLRRLDIESLKELAKRLSEFTIPMASLASTLDNSSSIQSIIEPLFNKILRAIPCCEKPDNNLLVQLQELLKIFDAVKKQGFGYLNNLEYDLDKEASKAETGWTGEGFDTARALVKECHVLLKKLKAVDEEFVKTVVCRILPFAKTFRQTYLSQGYVSFDGLLTLTRDLLQNREYRYIREKLKNEFRAILVDEFQDTDPVQYEIVLFLSEALGHYSKEARKVALEPGKLFIVGDPKQSIYAFRRADIEAYEQVVKQVCGQEETLKLQENFRSHSGIIEAVNQLFDGRIMVEQPGLQPCYISIHANRPQKYDSQKVEVVLVSDKEGKELKADEAREAEAEWIARWITKHVDNEAIEDKAGKGLHRLKYKDAALLLRAFTQVRPYVEAFKRYGIPYIVEGEKYFYTTQEILDFINLLRVIENPHDAIALAGVLRSPIVGLTDREIYELKMNHLLDYRKDISSKMFMPCHDVKNNENNPLQSPFHKGGFRGISKGEQGEFSSDFKVVVEYFYNFLRKIRVRADILPASQLIAEIMDGTHIAEITASAWHGEQKLANLWKLYQMACDMEQTEGISLKTFIDRITMRIKEAREEGESPLSDETLDVVKILTIHKSKGLEFPVVILGNLHGEVRNDKEALDSAIFDWSTSTTGIVIGRGSQQARNLQSIVIEKKLNARSWEEEKRVLYVAMTRAKERLILTGSVKDDDKSYMGLITQALMDAAGIQLGDAEVKKVPLGNAEVFVERFRFDGIHRPSKPPKEKEMDANWESFVEIWKKREDIMAEAVQTPLFVSPSTMADEEAIIRDMPHIQDNVEEISRVHLNHAALIGSVCHRALEGWDFHGTREELQRSVELAAKWVIALERDKGSVTVQGSDYINYHETIPMSSHLKGGDEVARLKGISLDTMQIQDVEFLKAEAVKILSVFLDSEAYRELQDAEILGREEPILLRWNGQVMRGAIDVLYKIGSRIIIADYKTDRVKTTNLAAQAEKYRCQKEIYVEAVKRCLKIDNPEFRLIFLRAGKSISV